MKKIATNILYPKITPNKYIHEYFRQRNQVRFFKEGAFIPKEEISCVYCVCKGIVKIELINPKGDVIKIGIILEGGIIALAKTIAEAQTLVPLVITAMEDSLLYYLTRDQIYQIVREDSTIGIYFIEALSSQIVTMMDQIHSLTLCSPRERLLKLLLVLCSESQGPGEKKIKPVKIAQRQIAESIGVTRVCVTRLMAKLQNDKLLEVKNRIIYPCDDFIVRATQEIKEARPFYSGLKNHFELNENSR